MDFLYDLAEALTNFMNGEGWTDIAVTIVAALLLVPGLVVFHELGHAAAAVVLGHRVRELRVGDNDTGLTLRWHAFTLRLGPITGERDFAGYVVYDGSRVGAWHVLLIALAGPLASLASGLAAAFALVALQSHSFVLMMALVGGLEMGVVNLSAKASDGRQVRAAWRALRAPAPPSRIADPHEATSVAPPGY